MRHWLPTTVVVLAAALGHPSRVGSSESTGPGAKTNLRGGFFQQRPITLEELQLAGDTLPRDPSTGSGQGRALLERAYASSSVAIRATAVRLLGRMELAFPDKSASEAWLGLDDKDAGVRREAALAIGQGHAGDAKLSAADSAKVNARDLTLIESRLDTERNDDVAGTLLQSLGRLHVDAAGTTAIERYLVAHATGAAARRLGAEFGLLTLTVPRDVKARVEPATRARLRELATTGVPASGSSDLEARTRRLAMNVLQTLNDTDVPTVVAAYKDPDWQVRRFAVMMTNLSDVKELGEIEKALIVSAEFQVRWEALRIVARGLTGTTPCTELIAAIDDREPIVQIQALSLLKAACPERDAIVAKITPVAESLRTVADKWHVPSAALTALSKLAPAEAKRLVPVAMAHKAWEVRAAAASVIAAVATSPAKSVGDYRQLSTLARDPSPNVRSAAIDAFLAAGQAGTSDAIDAAIDGLSSDDHQLVRTAARSLPTSAQMAKLVQQSGPLIDRMTTALLASLDRLTKAGKDNSRDARTAILDRLKDVMPPASAEQLRPYLTDFDPTIASSAAAIMTTKGVTGVSAQPHLRPLEQPTLAELRALPTHMTIKMADGGVIEMELLRDDAPVTVWRFASLAKKGYYNGLTFHRIVPNFVVQGGSPGASEYVGDARFMRDEEGLASNVRGAVGVSTRGRDTGDAQLFFDLVDYPRLDHDYTVFARVQSGMDVVDHMLEGARIATITVK